MDRQYTCCVTGHRNIPEGKVMMVWERMQQEFLQALDMGYTHFISGFAIGVDLLFADIVVELKRTYPITLEAAIPYRNRLRTPDLNFQRLINECDIVTILAEQYSNRCFI